MPMMQFLFCENVEACVNKDLKSILNLLQLSLPSPYLFQIVIFLDTVSVQVKK